MSVDIDRQELAAYRLRQAEESLDEAKYLLSGDKSPRSVINRIHYSMFHTILALLISEPYSSSKHSGVLSYSNRCFIKTGLLPKELGRIVNKAFDLRQRGDYREQTVLTYEQVFAFVDPARVFIEAVRNYLKDIGHLS